MRPCLLVFAFVALASFGAAQGFECQPVGPFPTICCADCENVQSNAFLLGTSPATGVDNTPTAGFPVGGAQYARIQANGPMSLPAGGPVIRPLPLNVAELRIPVPPGAPGVTVHFEFFNADSTNSSLFNDGFAAAIVGVNNDLAIVELAYRDSFSAVNAATDSVSGGTETGTVGVDLVTHLFTAAELLAIQSAGGAYLSLGCWNGGDNLFDSHAVVDCVSFGSFFPIPNTGVAGGSIIQDLTANPADDFTIGAANPTILRFQGISPNVFIEGYHCFIAQPYGDNWTFTVPGIIGNAIVDPTRPFFIMSDGKLTGGLAAGTAARGPSVSALFTDPSLCGFALMFQAYGTDEHLGSPFPNIQQFSIAYIAYLH